MPIQNVTPDRAPLASVRDLYEAYAGCLPGWFRRLRVPDVDVDDAAQDVWLEVGRHPEQIPANVREARRALFKVSARVAQRLRRRATNHQNRQHPTTELEDIAAEGNLEARASDALALFEELDHIAEPARRMVIAAKVFGYTDAEIAQREGLSEDAVKTRIWRTCAQLSKKLRKRDEEQRGALLFPGLLVIDGETRAAICAIWEAEGRLPQFGGPKGPPPPPPPFFPVSKLGALPLSLPLGLTPKLGALAVLVSLPLLGGLALVLALLTRPRERPALARSCLLYTSPSPRD